MLRKETAFLYHDLLLLAKTLVAFLCNTLDSLHSHSPSIIYDQSDQLFQLNHVTYLISLINLSAVNHHKSVCVCVCVCVKPINYVSW